MKKLNRTYPRCALTAALVRLVMLIAGSIWDLPIAKVLDPGHESSIGQFFAAFGELPAFSLLAGCGVLLIVHRAKFRPELNITEISDKIGFSSSRYFSKCFKDIYHVSPLAYRKGEEADKDEEEAVNEK